MMVHKVTLPEEEEMRRRLCDVDRNTDFQQRLYPKLLRSAGERKSYISIVAGLTLAIHDYRLESPGLSRIDLNKVPDFIDALIPDGDVAARAKEFFIEDVLAAT
jgi:hypothetical protein